MVAWLKRKADTLEKAGKIDKESGVNALDGSIKATADIPVGNAKEEL